MPTSPSPQPLSTSLTTFQHSFNTRLQKLLVFTLGLPSYLNILDLKYVFDRDPKSQEFKSSQQQQVYRQSIEKNISTYLAVGAVSSIGMNLIMQKISPRFSAVTAGKLIMDLSIASVCIGTGLYLSLTAIQPDLVKLKKMYFEQRDRHFLNYLRHQGAVYDIPMEGQIRRFLNEKEYGLWNASEGIELLSLVQ